MSQLDQMSDEALKLELAARQASRERSARDKMAAFRAAQNLCEIEFLSGREVTQIWQVVYYPWPNEDSSEVLCQWADLESAKEDGRRRFDAMIAEQECRSASHWAGGTERWEEFSDQKTWKLTCALSTNNPDTGSRVDTRWRLELAEILGKKK